MDPVDQNDPIPKIANDAQGELALAKLRQEILNLQLDEQKNSSN
jgi:hypothetical protein